MHNRSLYLIIVITVCAVLYLSTRPQRVYVNTSTYVSKTVPCRQEQVGEDMPVIYGITPTYKRLTQKADLIRLSQTLQHLKSFHWIVVEDSVEKTPLVTNLLAESNLNYTHLHIYTERTPWMIAKGSEQRTAGLDWLRHTLTEEKDRRGIVYFMDDDNTYSLKLFDEMRKIKTVGIWPVGLAGGMKVERPIVKGGKIVGFNAGYVPERPFPTDMAGFALNVTRILDRLNATFNKDEWDEEGAILKQLVTREELEPLADNCSLVYVWHTKTLPPVIHYQETYIDSRIEV